MNTLKSRKGYILIGIKKYTRCLVSIEITYSIISWLFAGVAITLYDHMSLEEGIELGLLIRKT